MRPDWRAPLHAEVLADWRAFRKPLPGQRAVDDRDARSVNAIALAEIAALHQRNPHRLEVTLGDYRDVAAMLRIVTRRLRLIAAPIPGGRLGAAERQEMDGRGLTHARSRAHLGDDVD